MRLITILSLVVLADPSYASDIKDKWEALDSALVDYHFNGKRTRLPDIVVPLSCEDREGSDIDKDKCQELKEWINGPGSLVSLEKQAEGDGCLNEVRKNQISECQMSYNSKSKERIVDQQKRLESLLEVAQKTVPRFAENHQSRAASNLKTITAITAHLADPSAKIKSIATKKNSKECKVYHITADICRKAYVEAAANKGLAVEEEATKQSGAVNLYSRYKLGQMKALHGTGNLTQLKKQYRGIVGSDWTPKTCEASPETKRKLAAGEATNESEELQACGCVGLDCQEID